LERSFGANRYVALVGGNPLADLQALTDVRLVIHNGSIIRDETQAA